MEGAQRLHPVEFRHHNVERDQIGPVFVVAGQTLKAVGGFRDHLPAGLTGDASDPHPHDGGIVDHQQPGDVHPVLIRSHRNLPYNKVSVPCPAVSTVTAPVTTSTTNRRP